ncbi:YlxR family protein [Clostridium sp. 'deep sea']|uniref:RNase P modulator RnpM n=1 Tax=Clostridium sp. 'deep sea' TaxID=2779445 RepID=UPI0018964CAC|nr:YlxR family protein [Clostridium sp. 'deep sea']QOR36022.1 YlxR family protein [Clostridium sp. 'deep sea']
MKKRKIPKRMCIACREMKEKKQLLRVVKTPEGDVKVDTTGKVNGRGSYLCKNSECINQAIKKKQISRALEVNIPADVYEELKKLGEQNQG